MKFLVTVLLYAMASLAQQPKVFHIKSPDGKVAITVEAGAVINWSVQHQNTSVITASAISLTLGDGTVFGRAVEISGTKTETVNTVIKTPLYKKSLVIDHYNQLEIDCNNGYGIIFRAYNDGAAYRFFTSKKEAFTIKGEEANFNFDKDYKALVPYVRDLRDNDKFCTAYEALYDDIHLSQFAKDTLAFLPALVKLDNNKKAVILEADLEDYPGMYLNINNTSRQGLQGVFAAYPLEEKMGGFNSFNYMPTQRAAYIAKVQGSRSFPWRAIVISEMDKDLANNDMVQKLASPSRIKDPSWIKPGKVAWDWWNDWNLSHVDFNTGVNTPTYKYYIDFAAANKIEYIVLDEGWSETDITKVKPAIALQQLIDYGKNKNVGIILWSTWHGIYSQLDVALAKYSAMGIKGFKIDFIDRDDQKMVASLYKIASKAADHKLVIDYHGMYKPTGIQKTYPNILNFEGVKGMENVKWTPNDNMPLYDVTIPFIRMMAGPMDYTPGAMRNTTKGNFRPSNSMPMSQGTRCHQLAMYVVFEAPLQMLADNPTAYKKEQECTNFIAAVPTVFDETIALEGEVGGYVAIARRKNSTWYIGALGNWDARDITLNFSFLGKGTFSAEIFKDGINAERDATDYKKEITSIVQGQKNIIHLAAGGGWAAKIYPVK